MNNKYIIKVGHPLVRPGLTIETEASEKYLTEVVNTLMKNVRVINDQEAFATITGTPTKDHPPIAWDKDFNPLTSVGEEISTSDPKKYTRGPIEGVHVSTTFS